MNKKSFSASEWFVRKRINLDDHPDMIIRDRSSKQKQRATILAPFNLKEDEQVKLETDLNRFFIPGWKGESLISKNVKTFIKTIDLFHLDVKKHFLNVEKFSRRQKMAIYEEFLNFAEYRALNCPSLDSYISFWKELQDEDSQSKDLIDQFINIFSFRIAVIYLFKVRFISTLLEQTKVEFDIKNILYPNSFLTSVFRSASSSELKAKSFEQNIFSWYRPSQDMKSHLLEYSKVTTKLNITEIIKTISIKSEELLNQTTLYSHSISHKQFGLFINSLLINFPIWLQTLNKKPSSSYLNQTNDLEIISCKFAGDYLESMGLSHWLAQHHNKDVKWEQILCPDFKNDDFANGLYLKNLSELQFLTFLAEIANTQGNDPINFLCTIVNSHLYNRKNSHEVQKSLLLNDDNVNCSTYDRVILNLVNCPNTNPQHYIISKIQNQKQFLKKNGFIFVMTSKKIFVPSQKQKVEQLLNNFKLEGFFNLSDIEGKGEVGSFIYVFKNVSDEYDYTNKTKKHNCLNFRYAANLKTFHEFEKITRLTHNFFHKNLGDLPPMSQLNDGHHRMEFYQDAIVGGQLINSTNKDVSSITHPNFFKKLMSLCNPLDYFFEIQNIDFNNNKYSNEDTFFDYTGGFNREVSPYILIVDQRSKDEVRIEIVKSSLLEVKSYEYGHSLCSYFYIYNKWPNINVLAIKDFLDSSIGKQIINMTFNNELRKVKGNLGKLLIPKFYIDENELPSHLKQSLELLEYDNKKLMSIHPSALETTFNNIECFIPSLINEYPAEILKLFSVFKRTIKKSLEQLGNEDSTNILDFNNPILKTPLVLSKTYPLYPDNDEVYVDFTSEANSLIHSNLQSIKVITQEIHNETSHGIEFYVADKKVLTFYSEKEMILFLEFLSEQLIDFPISKLLQSISVPRLEDLKSIISSYNSLRRTLKSIDNKLPKIYNQLLNSTILSKK